MRSRRVGFYLGRTKKENGGILDTDVPTAQGERKGLPHRASWRSTRELLTVHSDD